MFVRVRERQEWVLKVSSNNATNKSKWKTNDETKEKKLDFWMSVNLRQKRGSAKILINHDRIFCILTATINVTKILLQNRAQVILNESLI